MDINDAPRTASSVALRRFRTPIRGYAFAIPPPGAGSVDPGTPAALVREPANPADPLAVAVWVTLDAWGPWRLGYLDRGVAARIAPRLDGGLEVHAELEGWTPEPDGRWERPLIALWPAARRGSVAARRGPAAARHEPAATRYEPAAARHEPAAARHEPAATARGREAEAVHEASTRRAEPEATNEVAPDAVVRDARIERRLPGVRRRRVA